MESMKEKFLGRYARNRGTVSPEEQQLLKEKSVCVVGCGGLGGGVIEDLTRLGVGRLTIVDGDVFEESNLNRQVLSHEENLGRAKAAEGAAQMKRINSEVAVTPLVTRLGAENARDIVRGHDVVVDALDNVQSRLILEDACAAEEILLVHGAIGGWNGQAAVVIPGSGLLHRIYGSPEENLDNDDAVSPEEEKEDRHGASPEAGDAADAIAPVGNPSFTPAIVAGVQAAEVLKLLLDREGALKNRLLMLDLLEHEYEIIDFGG